MAEILAIMYGTGAVVPVQTMRTYSGGRGGGGGLATLIINLDTIQRRLVRFTFPPLHPRDSLRYVLNTRLTGPQSLPGCS